ncbi:hypothetical protein ACFWHQ_30070 [Streptomyces sp. NPDC060334]|uniref:hypothetical protein n=1 Tax=unclassified Streptomyces TaxID=2593676 RepID=UPI00332AA163
MSAPTDARRAGLRVEEVLDRLAATGDREACAAAEELVRVLMDLYGAGLASITTRLDDEALATLLDDELVSGLLALHDLHPEDAHTRIARALAAVREPVELVGFDEGTGVLRLRSAPSSGCGCGGGDDGGRQAVEDALASFAPEVTEVRIEAAAPQQPLLQIGVRPNTSPARVS